MPAIETISDLFHAGGAWTVAAFNMNETLSATATEALTARYGDLLTATQATINTFVGLVNDAMQAAAEMAAGRPVAANDVPVMPGIEQSDRYLTQGIVSVRDPRLSSTDKPYKTTVPFQQPTEIPPDQTTIEDNIEPAIEQIDPYKYPEEIEYRKRRERVEYYRSRGTPLEYDIAPFFIWRTA